MGEMTTELGRQRKDENAARLEQSTLDLSKKDHYKKLPTDTQNMLRVANTKAGESKAKLPNEKLLKLLKEDKLRSLKHLNTVLHKISDDEGGEYSAIVTQGNVTLVFNADLHGRLSDDDPAISVFHEAPKTVLKDAVKKSEQKNLEEESGGVSAADTYEIAYDAGALESKEIAQSCKVHIGAARCASLLLDQLYNLKCKYILICGKETPAPLAMEEILEWNRKKKTKLNEIAEVQKLFIPKLLSRIKKIFHNYFQECRDHEDGDDLPTPGVKILWGITGLGDTLPGLILPSHVRRFLTKVNDVAKAERGEPQPKRQRLLQDDPQGQRAPAPDGAPSSTGTPGVRIRDPRGGTAHCTVVPPEWKPTGAPNKHYGTVFKPRSASIPKWAGTSLCAMYHLNGRCRLGHTCPRKITHGVLPPEVKNELVEWIKQCFLETDVTWQG